MNSQQEGSWSKQHLVDNYQSMLSDNWKYLKIIWTLFGEQLEIFFLTLDEQLICQTIEGAQVVHNLNPSYIKLCLVWHRSTICEHHLVFLSSHSSKN